MKVLHVAQKIAGGPASHLNELWRYQRRRWGEENISFLIPLAERGHLRAVPESSVIPFASSKRSVIGLLRFALAIAKAVTATNPDVIHLHSTYAGVVGRISLFLLGCRKKIVYTPHGWAFFRNDNALLIKLYSFCERALSRVCRAVVCVSKAEYDAAIKIGFPKGKLRLIRNGIDVPMIDDVRGSRGGKIIVLYVGRFDRQKGIDVIFDLIRLERKDIADSFCFRFVGDYVVDKKDESSAPVHPGVQYCGWLPREDVLKQIAECDVLLMPSRWEGLPITALEAMALGKALVVSNIPPLLELVTDRINGITFDVAGGASALAEALESLSVDDVARYGDSSRERFLESFQAGRMNELIGELYNEALKDTK